MVKHHLIFSLGLVLKIVVFYIRYRIAKLIMNTNLSVVNFRGQVALFNTVTYVINPEVVP